MLLTFHSFQALLDLILALDKSDCYCCISKMTVCRLRRALKNAAGAKWAKSIIQTGANTEYFLGMPSSAVACDRSFAKLPPWVLSPQQRAALETGLRDTGRPACSVPEKP